VQVILQRVLASVQGEVLAEAQTTYGMAKMEALLARASECSWNSGAMMAKARSALDSWEKVRYR